eukprot:355638-Chlamydomonas_euryale.AAC.1
MLAETSHAALQVGYDYKKCLARPQRIGMAPNATVRTGQPPAFKCRLGCRADSNPDAKQAEKVQEDLPCRPL